MGRPDEGEARVDPLEEEELEGWTTRENVGVQWDLLSKVWACRGSDIRSIFAEERRMEEEEGKVVGEQGKNESLEEGEDICMWGREEREAIAVEQSRNRELQQEEEEKEEEIRKESC